MADRRNHGPQAQETATMDVKQFSQIELSPDGNAVVVTAELLDDGGLTKCVIPYRHAVWLAKAIFSVSHQAVERQTAGGVLEPVFIAQDALRAEAVQVLVKPTQEFAAIDSVGKWTSNNSPGTTTLLIDRSHAQVLIDQLRQFLEVAQSLSRLS
jgi:hypothetical protein